MKLEKIYKKQGYVIIQNALDIEEVNKLRNHLKKKINFSKNKNLINISECIKDVKIYNLLAEQKIANLSKIIFGENYYVNELEVQYNSFPSKKNSAYHYDAQSERENQYLKNEDYKFAKWGIYLQKNTNKYGGGLSVLPGSHKFLPVFKTRSEKYIKYLMGKLAVRINTNPGDAILFDSRLLHTGTSHQCNNKQDFNEFIKDNEKIVIYWNVTNKKYSDKYLKNNLNRCFKDEMTKKIDLPYFSESLKLYFPDDYNENIKKFLVENSINFSSLDKEKSDFLKIVNSSFDLL